MKTFELLERINIPRHKLYYLEQKGYIKPNRLPMGDLEAREYSKSDVKIVKTIWKYLQQGYRHKTAYQKALEELEQKNNKIVIL
jgi:DNA-binding transcriptional MerR regulator